MSTETLILTVLGKILGCLLGVAFFFVILESIFPPPPRPRR